MGNINFEIEGMEELVDIVNQLGKLPQKVVTQAAKDGGQIALAAAKVLAPEGPTKNLRKGIILHGERKRVSGKKVYDVMMDPKMNDIFVNITKDGKRYYYPSAVEYGFITKKGKKTEGRHFLRDALTNNADIIERAVLDKLIKGIDKELSKR